MRTRWPRQSNALAVAGFCIALAAPAVAGTLTNVSAVASTNTAGATGVTYTLTYTIATAITPGVGLLAASFPSNVTLPNISPGGAVGACAAAGVTVTVNSVAQTLSTFLNSCTVASPGTVQLESGFSTTVTAGSTIVVTIPNGTNGNPFTASSFLSFETEFDSASPLPTLGPAAPPAGPAPIGTPTLSEWAFIALAILIASLGYWKLRRPRQYPM